MLSLQRADIHLVMPAHDLIRALPFFLGWAPRDRLPVLGDRVYRGLIILGTGAKPQVQGATHRVVSNSTVSNPPVK